MCLENSMPIVAEAIAKLSMKFPRGSVAVTVILRSRNSPAGTCAMVCGEDSIETVAKVIAHLEEQKIAPTVGMIVVAQTEKPPASPSRN